MYSEIYEEAICKLESFRKAEDGEHGILSDDQIDYLRGCAKFYEEHAASGGMAKSVNTQFVTDSAESLLAVCYKIEQLSDYLNENYRGCSEAIGVLRVVGSNLKNRRVTSGDLEQLESTCKMIKMTFENDTKALTPEYWGLDWDSYYLMNMVVNSDVCEALKRMLSMGYERETVPKLGQVARALPMDIF